MPRITVIGAGSTVFMRNIVGDILQYPALANSHFALYDIDQKRLNEAMQVAQALGKSAKSPARFSAHSQLETALDKADFVITMFQAGGYEPATVIDFEVSRKFGIRHTIGDTLGVAGIMRGLRSVPVFLEIAAKMKELCPGAWLLNYVNPMAMITGTLQTLCPDIKMIGLCHSVQGTAHELAHDLDLPDTSLRYFAAGINHMAFYLTLEEKTADGTWKNVYPRLLQGYKEGYIPKESEQNPRCPNLVRYEMLKYLGYFVTESSEHFAEYTPYFIKNAFPGLIEQFRIPLDEYPKRCIEQKQNWEEHMKELMNGAVQEHSESREYASRIIHSLWTGEPDTINANLLNNGLIDNLPADSCVEVPCLLSNTGIHPVKAGRMPAHLAALIRTNTNVQTLFMEAFIHEDPQYIYHAAMMDPHTSSEIPLEQIYKLTSALLRAHREQKGYELPPWI
ncbi:MAG: alpha-glucosidase/alpha-galactosidase [Spirochaetales bacterium]|nr:MAG: alpha-glucosidase/alpha-galactosidase [Spirochaetales bacterium]